MRISSVSPISALLALPATFSCTSLRSLPRHSSCCPSHEGLHVIHDYHSEASADLACPTSSPTPLHLAPTSTPSSTLLCRQHTFVHARSSTQTSAPSTASVLLFRGASDLLPTAHNRDGRPGASILSPLLTTPSGATSGRRDIARPEPIVSLGWRAEDRSRSCSLPFVRGRRFNLTYRERGGTKPPTRGARSSGPTRRPRHVPVRFPRPCLCHPRPWLRVLLGFGHFFFPMTRLRAGNSFSLNLLPFPSG